MSDELKACPFCGGHIYTEEYPSGIDAHCMNKKCVLYGKNLFCLTLDQLNTRPLEDALRAELAAKDAEIERLRDALQERKPIPVSERLPNISERVYVAMKNGWQCIATYYGDYWKNDCGEKIYNVTHWMPLPPAPHIFKGVER